MKRYVVMGLVAVAIVCLLLIRPPQTAPPPVVAEATASPRGHAPGSSGDPIEVYVSGAVAHPGLFRLRDGTRVADAVRLAGGLRHDADVDAVNLAARLRDGDHVRVTVVGASQSARPARSSRPRTPRASTSPPVANVDVNHASAEELSRVPGIGKALAGRIVALRDQEGPFPEADALLDVSGMTPARLERARDYIRFYH